MNMTDYDMLSVESLCAVHDVLWLCVPVQFWLFAGSLGKFPVALRWRAEHSV